MPTKTILVPASTTNLGAGFDALGLALKLYLRIEIDLIAGPESELIFAGEGSGDIPVGAENLIIRVMQRVFAGERRRAPHVRLRIFNEIPIARGLGSSAAAIVAGISCYEAITGDELEPKRFFRYAIEFENEPDNITAARYGGFTITCVDEEGRIAFFRSPIELPLQIILTVPEFHLSTERARAVIPPSLSLFAATFNIQRSSLMVAALLRNEFHLMREALRDQIHQSHRAPLVPGFADVLLLNENGPPGLIGSCLSGAGPSILSFVEADAAAGAIAGRLGEALRLCGVSSKVYQLGVDNTGRIIS